MNMKWSLNLGKIAGIRMSVHWTFIILIGWIFFMHYRMGHDTQQALMGVLFIIALFVCVTLHELGHALTAKRFNIITESITLLPIGGLARMEKMPDKPIQELWVAIAGPLVNIAIAIGLYAYLMFTNKIPPLIDLEHMQLHGAGFWFNLLIANIILALFNLIPAFPMDGGRVLRALLALKLERTKATKIAAGIGQFLAIAFVFLGFFSNIWLVFIGVFIYLGAGAESAHETTKHALSGHKVKDVLMLQYSSLLPDDTLDKAVYLLLNGQDREFIVADTNKVYGILTRNELIRGLSEHGKTAAVSNVMRKDFITYHPETQLQEVYQKMMTSGCVVGPVILNGKLLGIVDKENIEEMLLINQVLG